MALAIDASSPAAVQGATATTTTASFTPPANAAYVAFVAADADSGATDETCTVSDSSGMTWTLAKRHNGSPGADAEVWQAYSASAPGSITVSVVDNKGSVAKRMLVRVFTGAATTVIGATNGTNANSLAYTSTAANSWGWAVGLDGNTAAPVAGTAQTLEDSTTNIGVGDDVWTVRQNATTATPGTTVTMNVTTPGGALHHVAVEILELVAATSIPWRAPQPAQVQVPGMTPWTQRDRRDANTVAAAANPLPSPLDSAWQASARYWHLYGDAADASARTWQSLQRNYTSDPNLLTTPATDPLGMPTGLAYRTAATHVARYWAPVQPDREGYSPGLLDSAELEGVLLGSAETDKYYAVAATHSDRRLAPQQRAYISNPALLLTALLENELLGGGETGKYYRLAATHTDRREAPQQRAYISDPSFYPATTPTDPLTVAWGAGGMYWLLYNGAALNVSRREVPQQNRYQSVPGMLLTALLESPLLGGIDSATRQGAWFGTPARETGYQVRFNDVALLADLFDVTTTPTPRPYLTAATHTDRREVPNQPVRVKLFFDAGPGLAPLTLAWGVDGNLWHVYNRIWFDRPRWPERILYGPIEIPLPCIIVRPTTGTTTRPGSGLTARPDTGVTEDPC